MTRVVGTQPREEFTFDPELAWRRGRLLDAMLAGASLPLPHGVHRARHEVFNAMDDKRQLDQARLLNGAKATTPA